MQVRSEDLAGSPCCSEKDRGDCTVGRGAHEVGREVPM